MENKIISLIQNADKSGFIITFQSGDKRTIVISNSDALRISDAFYEVKELNRKQTVEIDPRD